MNVSDILIDAVKEGLQHIENAYQQNELPLTSKGTHTETALADLKVGHVVTTALRSRWKGARLLVEETAPTFVDLRAYDLVVDPIDSTRGLLHNLPGTGCAIVQLVNGVPVQSCIGQITTTSGKTRFLHDIICGCTGKNGSCFDGRKKERRYRASFRTAPNEFIVCVEMDAFDTSPKNFTDGFRIAEELMPPKGKARAIRMFGSSSFGFVAVSRGSLDIFTGSRKPWDYLPGIPLLIGSGASYFFYTDRSGNLRICAAGSRGALAYAKEVHLQAGMKILETDPVMLSVAASV
ncbi:MAG: hypothetical protein Greene041679_130 [Parcubacteria group bacterium Greene0416_79]|nr:MAG: hypothetical protein Greene041679_130 [Parcubacteria group bacterium Greene0416_79]